jgi:hypothetical protein
MEYVIFPNVFGLLRRAPLDCLRESLRDLLRDCSTFVDTPLIACLKQFDAQLRGTTCRRFES